MKALNKAEVSLEKVYGRGAFDDNLKDYNRLRQWSFIDKKKADIWFWYDLK